MLNRTNRTQSAQSYRLDLGTRMLGLKASGNIGNLTLRAARSFPAVVSRTGVVVHPWIPVEAPPIAARPKPMKPAMPAMPGSSPRPASPQRDSMVQEQGQTAWLSTPGRVLAVRTDAKGRLDLDSPQVSRSQGDPRLNLGWPCDPARRAGRSTRAFLALEAGAASSS